MCFRQRSVDIYLCFVRVFATEILLEQLLHRLPSLETAEVKQFVNGPESFTPDGRYILGHAPEVFIIIIVVVISSSSSYHNNHHHNFIIIIIIPSSVPTLITSLKCINLRSGHHLSMTNPVPKLSPGPQTDSHVQSFVFSSHIFLDLYHCLFHEFTHLCHDSFLFFIICRTACWGSMSLMVCNPKFGGKVWWERSM